VKIYLFNPETGIYQGEAFADENPRQRGVFVVPPGATTIAQPAYGCGQVPVFSVAENRWELKPVFAAEAGSGGDPSVQANRLSERRTFPHTL
jgi:hypothetical protein